MYKIGILLFLFIIKVESNYYVYTYNNGSITDDEQCCLVRIEEKFCLGKPLTRSLIQINKECQQLDANKEHKNYLNNIVRRLYTESIEQLHDKILIQLQKPLEKIILKNDLLCLTTTSNNINLDKCYIEVTADKPKKLKKKTNKNETINEEVNQYEKIRRVEVIEPIIIRNGHGLSVRQTYELNLTNYRVTTNQERQCWLWYRQQTKKILNYPIKSRKFCIQFTIQREKCLEQLFYRKLSNNEQESYSKTSIHKGSKLYCETFQKQTKLIGYNRNINICFTTHYQIYIEYKFTDYFSLSDLNKNKDVLEFISNNTKLTNEFQTDCNDKKTLDDIKKSIEEEKQNEPITIQVDSSTQE